MRAVLLVICGLISAVAATMYITSSNNPGLNLSSGGLSYEQPNHLALYVAVIFGVLAIGLLAEPYLRK